MKILPSVRLAGALLLVWFLSACAGMDDIRGRLVYDLRPPAGRTDVVWPAPPDPPRYRYLGQLVGQANFDESAAKKGSGLVSVFKWVVGLFENDIITLQRPQHGVVGEGGRVYVVDAGRNAVMVFDPHAASADGKKQDDTKDGKKDGKAKADEDLGQLLLWQFAAPRLRFAGPVAVADIGHGEVAVSDAVLGFVVRLDVKGAPVGRIGAGQLKRPTGLAFDPARGWLFVADTVAQDIKVFDRAGQLVDTYGSEGEGAAQFNAPTHLTFANGQLYVSDTLNSRIQVLDGNGKMVREVGQRGLNVGNLVRPKGVAVDAAGIVYAIESYYGYMLAFNERNELLLGISGSGVNGDKFLLPSGIWIDQQGRVFVADMFNGRVVMFQFIGSDGATAQAKQ